jgi:hypothetical protein
MPYLGNEPGAITDAFTQSFTGDASTVAFTLSQASTTNSVFVRVHGVMQRNGTDFDVDGVTLTFTTAPPAGTNNIVVQFFTVGSVQEIAADAVTGAKIADNAIDSEHYTDGSIDTAHIADNQITLAKLAGGTDGNIISFDASGDPVAIATGNDGQVLTSTGAGSAPAFETISAGFTLASEQATTSGTSVTFGSIPTGTKMIVIMFEDVSFSGDVEMDIQIGDAGGIETSGYQASSRDHEVTTEVRSASSWPHDDGEGAGAKTTGQFTIFLKDAANFTWVGTGMWVDGDNDTGNAGHSYSVGYKSLSAELTQVSISGGTFDAGSISIMHQ